MKIFIGIPLGGGIIKHIAKWRKSHKQKLKEVNWKVNSDLHITLIPPYLGDAKLALAVIKKLAETQKAFAINFQEIAFGPSPAHPRLIWLKSKERVKLQYMKKQLEKLNPEFPRLKRPFLTHVTLARFKAKQFDTLPTRKLKAKFEFTAKITSLAIYATNLNISRGRRYHILARAKLRG